MRQNYTVVYQTIEDGWIMATVPELPGAVTQGETLEEARANIKDAVELLLQSYHEEALRQASAGAIVENLVVDLPTLLLRP
jgi:predicted RNase H-like HicB family nuclease